MQPGSVYLSQSFRLRLLLLNYASRRRHSRRYHSQRNWKLKTISQSFWWYKIWSSYLLYFTVIWLSNWFFLGEINNIDRSGLKDARPGFSFLTYSSIFYSMHFLFQKTTLKISHFYNMYLHTVHPHVSSLSNPRTFKVQMTTTSNTLEEMRILSKSETWKNVSLKGRVDPKTWSKTLQKTDPQRVEWKDRHRDVFIYRVQSQRNHFTKCFVRRFNILAWLFAMEIYYSVSVHLSG